MISTSAVAPAALRAATALNTLVVPGASGTDTPSITDDPIVKGDDVTKHFEVPSEVALPVVPDLLDPGKTFVISPELIRG